METTMLGLGFRVILGFKTDLYSRQTSSHRDTVEASMVRIDVTTRASAVSFQYFPLMGIPRSIGRLGSDKVAEHGPFCLRVHVPNNYIGTWVLG